MNIKKISDVLRQMCSTGEDNAGDINVAIEAIYTSTPEISRLITMEEMGKRFEKTIATAKKSGRPPSDQDAKRFMEDILKEPVTEWTVVGPLWGVSLGATAELKYGPFTLFPSAVMIDRIKARNPRMPIPEGDFFQRLAPVSISCEIRSSKGDRAKELARVYFEQYELVMAYMLGMRKGRYHVAVFNVKHRFVENSIAYSGAGMALGSQLVGPLYDVDMNDAYFRSEKAGNKQLWDILSLPNPSEIEKRLINAVEWTGRAIIDEDDAKAMIQSMLAIECLLQSDQGNIIKPSIMSQISEIAAFILGRDYDARIRIEKRVKELYHRRSAHVHGGSRQVDRQDLNDAMRYARGLIQAFLTSPELQNIRSSGDLREHIQKMKYSQPVQTA